MGEQRTILFVDDEENVLKSLERALLDERYECLFATSGKQALDLLEQHVVHVICVDMRMPGMNGLELLKLVKDRHPAIVRVLLSGYVEVGASLAAVSRDDVFGFIPKPRETAESSKSLLRQAVSHYDVKVHADSRQVTRASRRSEA